MFIAIEPTRLRAPAERDVARHMGLLPEPGILVFIRIYKHLVPLGPNPCSEHMREFVRTVRVLFLGGN